MALSILALTVSLVGVYLQWFRIRGPIIARLNTQDEQRTMLLPYRGLPQSIQQYFPDYKEKSQGYALVRLVFANSGDRTGLAEIKKVEVQSSPALGWPVTDRIKASYYNYTLVPAYEISSPEVLLRNISPIDGERVIEVDVEITWGGANPRSGEYKSKGTIKQILRVLLVPGEVASRTSQN